MYTLRAAPKTSRYASIVCLTFLLAAAAAAQTVGSSAEPYAKTVVSAQLAPIGFITYTVTNNSDSGAGSLRLAIQNANSNPGFNLIDFDALFFSTPQTILLTTGEMVITDDVTITGPGANLLTVSGNNSGRIFFTGASGAITISGITITNGYAGKSDGGAIYVSGGALILNGVHVTASTADGNAGGVLYSGGGPHQIVNSTFSNNTAFNACGSFYAGFTTMTITNSTVSGNSAVNSIGGGFCSNGPMTARSVTVANNTSANEGGGIYMGDFLNIGNSIVAGNTSANTNNEDFYPGVTPISAGYNLIGDNSGVESGFPVGNPNLNNDIVGTTGSPVNPQLGPLANYGGTTPTHAFAFLSSPAIDKGFSFGLTTDQRGFLRPADRAGISNAADGADIGAYELQASTAASVSIGGRVLNSSGRGIANVRLILSGGSLPDPVYALTNPFGYYRFGNIPAGQVYIVSAGSKRFRFTDPVKVVNLVDDLAELDFVAEP